MKYIDIDVDCGEFLSKCVERMIKTFNQYKLANPDKEFQVRFVFNGVTLYVDKKSSVDSIVNDYETGLNNHLEAYKKTDEYKLKEQQKEERIKQAQSEANALMDKFINLDKTDTGALLQWLSDFQPYSDNMTVKKDNKLIIHELRRLGYESGMNVNDKFDTHNKMNYAGYIVGQCISMLERMGAIHQIIPQFVEEWKDKFEPPVSSMEQDSEAER